MSRTLRTLRAGVVAAVLAAAPLAASAAAAPAAHAAQDRGAPARAAGDRPSFRMPFRCDQTWRGNNWDGHSPKHAIDWNHYDANGTPDDYGRAVLASATGTVVAASYSTDTGYGYTIVVAHGDGWRTRYAHLKKGSLEVQKGDHVDRGDRLASVGRSSATEDLLPHLHYEQIHDGAVVVSVVQGVRYADFTDRYQKSTNGAGCA